jgi:hypothetical protein
VSLIFDSFTPYDKNAKFYSLLVSNFLYAASTPIAPSGAVIKIANTATVKIVLPAATPAARGRAPIAACTVAFGKYAIAQKIRSLTFSFVFTRQTKTPQTLIDKAMNKSNNAAIPAFTA